MPSIMHSSERTLAVADQLGQPIAVLHADLTHHLLTVRWEGNLTASEVIRVAEAAIQLRQQLTEPLYFLLNDKSKVTGDWSEALPWLEFEWLPVAVHNGLRAMAYVLSTDAASLLVSREFLVRISEQLPARAFSNCVEARRWLLQQRQVA